MPLFTKFAVALLSVFIFQNGIAKTEHDIYRDTIQPIFNQRCIACHSCFNAPCQLNLQSFEGYQRGASHQLVYDGTRKTSILPSRLGIDAKSIKQWRAKDFFEVHNSSNPDKNIFWLLVNLRNQREDVEVQKQVAATNVCPSTPDAVKNIVNTLPALGMPYGFPALKPHELKSLREWIESGAPGPGKSPKMPEEIVRQMRQWETYFNSGDIKQKLVSRYLYEHLFLAHIYFPEAPKTFFRLVRSSTECTNEVQEIASRRPNDDPRFPQFFYCLKPYDATITYKTHLPYEWSPKKLERYNELFYADKWEVTKLPTYEPSVAENPFIAFKDIPVKARYKFLLEDSKYEVATFIKGPVCNGSMAVNSIQEQFYTFFLDPSADNMALSKEFENQASQLLVLPGVYGSNAEVADAAIFGVKISSHREAYRKLRSKWLKKNRPNGYTLKDIWDGDKKNPNAVLTIFRHDDNAVISTGAIGDLSKTAFVLDYPIFERLVYNLVVNFDVYGNVSHQTLTRVYMDMIRTEAEELFLQFLPPEQRLQYRREWYRGAFASAKMSFIFPPVGSDEPTGIRYTSETDTKKQLISKILFYHLNEKTRGPFDLINWKTLKVPTSDAANFKVFGVEKMLREISSVKAGKKTPFSRFFPDVSILQLVQSKTQARTFSIIHNKEHTNISWILGESLRMAPEEDTLTIREGIWGTYPNMIFSLTEKDLPLFVKMVLGLKSEGDYRKLVSAFGVPRTQPHFWSFYDEINGKFSKDDPTEFGYLDLTRYAL